MAIKRIVLNHPYPLKEAAANVEKQLCVCEKGVVTAGECIACGAGATCDNSSSRIAPEYTHGVPRCPQCVLVCSRECNGTS